MIQFIKYTHFFEERSIKISQVAFFSYLTIAAIKISNFVDGYGKINKKMFCIWDEWQWCDRTWMPLPKKSFLTTLKVNSNKRDSKDPTEEKY